MGMRGPSLKAALTKALSSFASGQVAKRVAKSVAARAHALALEQFASGVDAYGEAWAAKKNGQRATLVKSGELANSFVASVKNLAISLVTHARHAYPLNFGWGNDTNYAKILDYEQRGKDLLVAGDEKGGKKIVRRAARRFSKFAALTSRAPARKLLPNPGEAGRWEEPLQDEANAVVEEALNK